LKPFGGIEIFKPIKLKEWKHKVSKQQALSGIAELCFELKEKHKILSFFSRFTKTKA